MVKHQKEKLYISAREYRQNTASNKNNGARVKRLPFSCCALTLNPYTRAVCNHTYSDNTNTTTCSGVIFDSNAIMEYILKHKVDPVSGKDLKHSDLIELVMDKNEQNEWQCPVLCKRFTDYSKVVAIRSNDGNKAHVLSYEAVRELNMKVGNMDNLISGEKFKRGDIIWLQDPDNQALCKLRDIGNFKHMNKLRSTSMQEQNNSSNIRHSITAARVMSQVASNKKRRQEEKLKQKKKQKQKGDDDGVLTKQTVLTSDVMPGRNLTSGACSGGFTSTTMSVQSTNTTREATDEEILEARFTAMKKLKKKGFVQLQTTLGNITVELHCDIVPRTTTNFLGLCAEGRYNNVAFHRNIKDFMIQCSSKKKDSLWGGAFRDEFDDRIKHGGRGVVAMANAGPGTNRDQFYITYKSSSHLDRKHSVFGKVIDGFEVLDEMEKVPTDKKDKPKHEIKIIKAVVAIDPSKEAEETERKRFLSQEEKRTKEKEARIASALGRTVNNTVPDKTNNGSTSNAPKGIGKYLPKGAFGSLEGKKKISSISKEEPEKSTADSKKVQKIKFGDFSSW